MARTVNLAGVKTSFEPMPEDKYYSKFSGMEYREAGVGKAKDAKDDYLSCEFTVTESIDGDGEFAGRKLWSNKSLAVQSLWAYKVMMLALGADPESLEGKIDTENDTKKFLGATVVLDVGVKTAPDGKPTNEVKGILSPTDFS